MTSTSFSNEVFCLYEGRWSAAREMNEVGLASDLRDPRHLALRAVLEAEEGNPDKATGYVDRLQESVANVPPPGPVADYVFLSNATALASVDDVRLDAARAAALDVLALPRLNPSLELYSRGALGLIAAARGDADAARALYGAIEFAH